MKTMFPVDYHHTTLVALAGTKEAKSVQEAKFAVWYQQCDVYIYIYIYIYIYNNLIGLFILKCHKIQLNNETFMI